MSDLSRLLDDVYGTGGEEPAPQPDWASDAALDGVFADWVPGELDDVPAPEPDPEPEPVSFAAPEVDPMESFADSDMFGASIGLVPPRPESEAPQPDLDELTRLTVPAWQPSDDDILPARRRGFSLSFRR